MKPHWSGAMSGVDRIHSSCVLVHPNRSWAKSWANNLWPLIELQIFSRVLHRYIYNVHALNNLVNEQLPRFKHQTYRARYYDYYCLEKNDLFFKKKKPTRPHRNYAYPHPYGLNLHDCADTGYHRHSNPRTYFGSIVQSDDMRRQK